MVDSSGCEDAPKSQNPMNPLKNSSNRNKTNSTSRTLAIFCILYLLVSLQNNTFLNKGIGFMLVLGTVSQKLCFDLLLEENRKPHSKFWRLLASCSPLWLLAIYLHQGTTKCSLSELQPDPPGALQAASLPPWSQIIERVPSISFI